MFGYLLRAIHLAWATNPTLTLTLAALTLLIGTLPAAVAWIGATIVDAVVVAAQSHDAGSGRVYGPALTWVAIDRKSTRLNSSHT